MTTAMLFAGFGGQGILFSGKQMAKSAMYAGKNVSWLPSYGPEMRGGAANCSVIISDDEVGSPLVTAPDILVAMNLPSFDKFEASVKAGGYLIVDSSLINKKSQRTDIQTCYIPATAIASENNIEGMANVIVLGQLLRLTGLFDYDTFLADMLRGIPESKAALIEKNKTALALGYNYNA
ncbi:MAG: 2-oxoacid:ferredoxin oxidoreductase subunit gamma [Clostridiales bacterium]|jgi:2-oxoglutarate ferredoxin oxidoreductase subunit gamma|nr:2-oxoacid:ferredoxin oxidoreductase subunit gamma [Clostridiales bacterium]